MKCPKCGFDHKKKDGRNCKGCGYLFIFADPSAGYKLTDGKFASILRKVSANSTRYFLSRHVQTAIATRPKSKSHYLMTAFVITCFISLFFGAALKMDIGWNGFFLIALIVLILAIIRYLNAPEWPSLEEVELWLKDWEDRFGPLEYWIQKPQLEGPAPAITESEKDLEAYGVQKMLIVDEDLLVDGLVRNHWQSDQQTLVVSASGYPSSALKLANRYLHENQDMTVYLYHSSAVRDFEAQIRSKDIIALDKHKVIDCGITTEMIEGARKYRKYYENVPGGVVHGDHLPIHIWHTGMTACLVGGLLMTDVLQSTEAAISFGIGSDFG